MRETYETRVWSLSQEDLLEEGMATYPSVLGWKIPWTEEPGRLPVIGSQRVRLAEATWHAHSTAWVGLRA